MSGGATLAGCGALCAWFWGGEADAWRGCDRLLYVLDRAAASGVQPAYGASVSAPLALTLGLGRWVSKLPPEGARPWSHAATGPPPTSHSSLSLHDPTACPEPVRLNPEQGGPDHRAGHTGSAPSLVVGGVFSSCRVGRWGGGGGGQKGPRW